MPIEIGLWLVPVIALACFLVGYGLGRLRSQNAVRQLATDYNEIALELELVKVSCSQIEAALENAELLHRSKNQFYSSTSHDLRQPLHALSMFSSVLQKQSLDDLSKEIVADIADAVLDVTREIDVLLNIARVDVEILKLYPVKIDLAAETKRIVHQFQRMAKSKNLELEVYTFTDDLVYLDRTLFDRVLRNLIDNAIKFTEEGYVRVTAGYSNGNSLRLTVLDTGIGISKEDQECIYREFYQGKNLTGNFLSGVGLGLNNVLKMISRLGGEINVASTGDQGTGVTVVIPNVEWGGVASNCAENIGDHRDLKEFAKSALVLESDIRVGKSTTMLLESAGYEVELASSLSEAYDIQRTHNVEVACLEFSAGEEAIRKLIEALRSVTPDMPIVVMTSNKETALKRANPDIDILQKPVNSKTLLHKLERSG